MVHTNSCRVLNGVYTLVLASQKCFEFKTHNVKSSIRMVRVRLLFLKKNLLAAASSWQCYYSCGYPGAPRSTSAMIFDFFYNLHLFFWRLQIEWLFNFFLFNNLVCFKTLALLGFVGVSFKILKSKKIRHENVEEDGLLVSSMSYYSIFGLYFSDSTCRDRRCDVKIMTKSFKKKGGS